jgi:cobaltochelatase CobS
MAMPKHVDPTNASGGREQAAMALLDMFEKTIKPEAPTLDEAKVRDLIQSEMKQTNVFRIEVKNRNKQLGAIEGHHHPMFTELLELAGTFGPDGYVPGIYLCGDASSGKTTATRNLGKVLGIPWRFNGAISQPHEMLGYKDAAGTYHRTPFRDAYEHGGVYCFDEVDRSDPNALLCVNPHLANAVAEFPDGQVARHPDCIIICTANTWGTGSNADYVGANKLDAAFLSRFPFKLGWNIDEGFERQIVTNPLWIARVQAARRRARDAGLKVMIDTRAALAGAALIESGATHDKAAQRTYLAMLKPEQVGMIEPDMVQ